MDWSGPMISAQQTLKRASEMLSKAPQGDRDGIACVHAEASALIEDAMVQLARILAHLQREDGDAYGARNTRGRVA